MTTTGSTGVTGIGDRIVERYDATVEDEYQSNLMHRSNTIGYHIAYYGYLFIAAALAWIVPAERNWAPLIVVVPMLASAFVATAWMKRNAPRPRILKPTPTEIAMLIVIVGVWLGGLQYNDPNANLATALGLVSGGIVGGIVGYAAGAWALKRGRRKDIERLDAEFADD